MKIQKFVIELLLSDMSFIKDPRGYLTAAAAVSLQLPIFVSISTTRIILGLHVLTHTQTKKTRTRLRPFEINYSQKYVRVFTYIASMRSNI